MQMRTSDDCLISFGKSHQAMGLHRIFPEIEYANGWLTYCEVLNRIKIKKGHNIAAF